MPHRHVFLAELLVGGLAAAALLLLGIDVRRAARRGSTGRQRLLSAGVAALVLVGLLSCTNTDTDGNGDGAGGDEAAASGTDTARSGGDAQAGGEDGAPQRLKADPRWRSLQGTWQEAAEIAGGKRGSFPFDRAGKTRILTELESLSGLLDDLVAADRLAPAEAALLRTERDRLVREVRAFRPVEMKRATCYEPMAVPVPARESLDYLDKRMAILEALAERETLAAPVLDKTLEALTRHLEVLGDPEERDRLDPEARRRAETLHGRAAALLETIRDKIR